MDQKKAYILLNDYVKAYRKKLGKGPSVNRYKDKWGFDAMGEDLGMKRAGDVIEFYFTLDRAEYSLNGLFFNYGDLAKMMDEAEKDAQVRRDIMERSKKRAEEWRRERGER